MENHIPAVPAFEAAAIDCIFMNPELMDLAINEVKLEPEHFFSGEKRTIYQAMINLHTAGYIVEPVALQIEVDKIDKSVSVSMNMVDTLTLTSSFPDTLNARKYFYDIKRAAFKRRKLIALAEKIAGLAYGDQEIDEDISDVQLLAAELDSERTGDKINRLDVHVANSIHRIDDIQKNGLPPGITSGFTMVDKILGRFQKSRLYVIGARPGMGKTSMVLNAGINACKEQSARVAFFGLEMSCGQLTNRILSMETGIDVERLNAGDVKDDEWEGLLFAANTLSKLNFYIDDKPAASVSDIRSKAKQLMADGGIDMIIIDYLQLMSGHKSSSGDNRQQEISFISRGLKNLARELDIPVVALSQLSREVEKRADKKPMLSDLRESGSLEQDSDVVMFIYREDYYIEDTDRQNIADVIVAKNRDGKTGIVSLYFRKELTKFSNLEIQRTELMD